MPEQSQVANSPSEGSNDAKITLEIDGEQKVFGADDVRNLIAQRASATQTSQKVAPLLKTLEKYEVDAETYLEQAEGAFAVTRKLIEAGLIDEKTGEIVQRAPEIPKPKPSLGFSGLDSSEKTAEIVKKAMQGVIGPLQGKIEQLEQEQLGLLRENISTKVRAKYPDFSETDISQLFGRAGANQRRGLWEHAEDLNKELGTNNEAREQAWAKKYGIDLEAKRNALKEQDDGGGGSAVSFPGKRFSFKKGPKSMKDADAMTPADAMQAHMLKALHKD